VLDIDSSACSQWPSCLALPERTLTQDGLEMQMGVNHFGHFYLTSKMLPTILETPGWGLHSSTSQLNLSRV
jgi:NAD(P)-dependent dehydrogenase (short-subunit alcohol dehydrogenase family)